MFFLSCVDCGVEVRLPNANKVLITSLLELIDLLEEWNQPGCQLSSSMDFPEEYTTDAETLALCNELQKLG
tara:strand:+ start:329 stop:541 length:213 start_codon:yes stop_codon:yes gene_type:complete